MTTILYQNPSSLYYYPQQTIIQTNNINNSNITNSSNINNGISSQIYKQPTQTQSQTAAIYSPQYVPIPFHPYMDTSINPAFYAYANQPNSLLPMKRLFSDADDEDLQYSTFNNNSSNSSNNNNTNNNFNNSISMMQHITQNLSSPIDKGSPLLESPDSPELYELPEEDAEELRKALTPFVSLIMKSNSGYQLLQIINECTKEIISVKDMLTRIKIFCSENSRADNIYLELLQTLVRLDGDIRMVNYLVENGVEDNDLQFVKDIELTSQSTEPSKKKRERKRESISRGIRSPPNKWTKAESQNLIKLVNENGDRQWKKIAVKLGGGKTGAQCAQHWKRVLSPEIKKGSWDEEEEELLFELVSKHGQSWKNVAIEIKTRTDIQCRYQYFKAVVSRQTGWSVLEDEILCKKVRSMMSGGDKVSFQTVAKHLARAKTTKIPRTSLECKTRWNQLQESSPNQTTQDLSPQLIGIPNSTTNTVPYIYFTTSPINNSIQSNNEI